MIENIFQEMREIGAVKSSHEFSIRWLGKEGSYMRGLRAKRRSPSVTVLATCAVRLLRTADGLKKTGLPYPDLNEQKLRKLASSCFEAIINEGAAR